MSLESNLIAQSPGYAAMRSHLRTKARVWTEERTPQSAVNARRQLNQAFDAGVSATVELLRMLDPLKLTEEEIETVEALRAGTAGVVPIKDAQTIEREREAYDKFVAEASAAIFGPSGRRTGRLEPAKLAPEVREGGAADERENEGESKTPMSDAIRRQTGACEAALDREGNAFSLRDRVTLCNYPLVGPGVVTFISVRGERIKMLADSNGQTYTDRSYNCILVRQY